ncbi:MAG: PP2C family protein-serine/threonine phosphatase, partial [Endozoicomonas sp.]
SALFSFTLNNVLSEDRGGTSLVREELKDAPFYRIRQPNEVLASLNQRFQASPEAMLYFTIAYGVINSRIGSVTLSQAGHPPPLWLKCSDRRVEQVPGGGVPVGMMPDMSYESVTLQFQPGDRLFLYSDGITECENEVGEQFGEQRLMSLLEAGCKDELKTLVDRVETEIVKWNGGDGFDDDVTYLILEWQP